MAQSLATCLIERIYSWIFKKKGPEFIAGELRLLMICRMLVVALCISLTYFFVKNRPDKPLNRFGMKANQKKKAFLQEHFTNLALRR